MEDILDIFTETIKHLFSETKSPLEKNDLQVLDKIDKYY